MKIATRTLLPAGVLLLAACGSGKTSSSSTDRAGATPKSAASKAASDAVAPTPEDKTTGTDKRPSRSRSGSGSSGSGAKSAPVDRFSGLTKSRAPRKAKNGGGIALPNRSELGVTSSTVYPAAAVVGAGARFDVLLSSFDGKRHTVKLATPTPRTVIVPADAKHPAQVSFPALRAGVYHVEVEQQAARGAHGHRPEQAQHSSQEVDRRSRRGGDAIRARNLTLKSRVGFPTGTERAT